MREIAGPLSLGDVAVDKPSQDVYQHCAEHHLHRYVAEFDFRYNQCVRFGIDDEDRTGRMLRGIIGKRLMYRDSAPQPDATGPEGGSMGAIIKLRISGSGAETDAPTVEDALNQIKDYVDILRGVEEAVAGSPTSALDWLIVDAHRSSPLEFDIQAFPRQFATNVDQRVEIVTTETARGLAILQARAERPPHFTNNVMKKAHRIFERVTNGLGLSEVDFGPELPKVQITPSVGRSAARNIALVLNRPDKPYQEIGSIEGYLQAVARGAYSRRVVYVIERITGEEVRCLITDFAVSDLASREIRDVWRYQRVEVQGRIYFAGPGKIDHIDAEHVRFLRYKADLPQIDDIIDPDFTGGLATEEYLERLRDGALS